VARPPRRPPEPRDGVADVALTWRIPRSLRE
jgi:hypothetical protein